MIDLDDEGFAFLREHVIDDAAVGTEGTIAAELRVPGIPTISTSIGYRIIEQPAAKSDPSKIALPRIDCQGIDKNDSEWVALGWSHNEAEVALDYNYAKDTLTIRYSTVFPRFKSSYDQTRSRSTGSADSFVRRYEIWLATSVLIHWQDTGEDKTPLSASDLEQEDIDNFRRDELRRVAKTCIVFAQRELAEQEKSSTADD